MAAAHAASLDLGRGLKLPIEAVTAATGVVGQRGTGKTSTAVVIAEEARDAGAHICVWDPTGAWYGLRTNAKGDGPGLDVVVFGGHHGDVPLEETAGKVVAELIVNEGYNVVLDVERMSKGAQARFGADFFETLYDINREAITVIIDEAHRPAPQQMRENNPYAARCLGAVIDCVALGRRKGIGVVVVTQRLSRLHKDVLEGCEIMLAHRLMGTNDRKAIGGWLQDAAESDAEAKAALAEIGQLQRGEVLAYAPAFDIAPPVRRTVRKKRTYDSSYTPPVGARVQAAPKGRAEIDLGALTARIADTIERAKAEDPKALRARIRELEKRLRAEIAQPAPEPQIVEVATLPEGHLEALRELHDLTDRIAHDLLDVRGRLAFQLDALKGQEIAVGRPQTAPSAATRDRSARGAAQDRPARDARPRQQVAATPLAPAAQSNGSDPQLKAGARRILETLARHHPMRFTKAQVGTLTGFKVTGGTFQTYWGTLKRAGYVQEVNGEVTVLEAGLDRAGVVPEAPASTEEMVAMWGERLKKGAREMLNVVVEAYPNAVLRDDLAGAIGMTASGGTFQTYLGTLRRNGLVEVEGGVVTAAEVLFIGGGA